MAVTVWLCLTPFSADAANTPRRAVAAPTAHLSKAKRLVGLYAISRRLAARNHGVVAIKVARRSVCALTFHRHGRKAGPFRATVDARYVVWRWKVPRRVRVGAWRMSVTCRHGRRHSTLRATIRVTGRRGGRAVIATRRSMETSTSYRKPDRSASGPQAGDLGGKGGGNPCADPRQPGSVVDAGGYCTGNCTHYVWTRRPDLTGLHNAYQWGSGARDRNIPMGQEPVVGAVAWWDRKDPTDPDDLGHVAYVQSVSPDGESYVIHEMNVVGYNQESTRPMTVGQSNGPTAFIYGGPASGAEFIGHIVHWDADPKTQKTAWLVVNDGGHARRRWIPDSATYYCLKDRGAPGPDELPAAVLSNQLADEFGVHAQCGGGGGTSQPPPDPIPVPTATPVPIPTQQPPPPARTWSEQETPNHPVNTFANYHNASGVGPQVAAGQWIQVSCKVHDGTIASVNPDGYWYRIASSPWNNTYYAPANTFMNGDPYGGPYTHNTDFAVPDC